MDELWKDEVKVAKLRSLLKKRAAINTQIAKLTGVEHDNRRAVQVARDAVARDAVARDAVARDAVTQADEIRPYREPKHAPALHVDDRDSSSSVRAVSGGAPESNRRKH